MKRSPKQREALCQVAEGRFYPDIVREDDGWHARWRGLPEDNAWVDEFVRRATITPMTEDAESQRHETLHDAWMMALRSSTGLVAWESSACAAFSRDLAAWHGAGREDVEARAALVFSLDASARDFILTCPLPSGRRALRALGQAAFVFGPLRGLRRAGDRLAVSLERAEAEDFIHHGARALAAVGYRVEGGDLAADIVAEANLQNPAEGGSPAVAKAVLTVRVAGEPVSADEIRFLLDQGSSLVFFRDRWIEVDRNILREALRALSRGAVPIASPMAFILGIGHVGNLEIASLKAHGWLRGLVNDLLKARREAGETGPLLASAAVPDGFCGSLRDYQRRGVAWLSFMTQHGFGALLADDMGLGKTIQTIAWLLADRASGGKGPCLIVAPLTLLENWSREFARFAPGLRVCTHQGETRHLASGFRRMLAETDVVLTSYTLLVRDYSLFSSAPWRSLVLDEAQTIKNPDAQVARAARALSPVNRLALTGTPVENSVADVWSIEEFLNPGFLGERARFVTRFVRPIAANGSCAAAQRLRHALEPFVLRRLMTEPSIAAELGEKREIREFCALTTDQRADYEAALENFRTGEHRSGDVFALLTTLKLVCDGAGKFERLCTLLEQIFDAGESVLIFTQYAKIGAWLVTELDKRFGRRFPFLHGGLSATARSGQIRAFNAPGARALILSLKAGGFGLNLTKATHVVHFDRWWNPAVENQATDRAHRIGQRNTVFVHVFITVGTVEEHVDEILSRKSRVAGAVITEAEWLEAVALDG